MIIINPNLPEDPFKQPLIIYILPEELNEDPNDTVMFLDEDDES